MQSLWQKLRSAYVKPYDFRRLIDFRIREPISRDEGLTHFVCDIDKTYLETSFEKFGHLVKIAFEDAQAKRTVLGATEVLLELRWPRGKSITTPGVPRSLNFVSSSPPQLRGVLGDKMILDGLDWTSDTFKNQAYNLMHGRMDQLRQHVVYKAAAILQVFQQAGPNSRFYLIGDNAESDAFIYLGVSLFVAGSMSPHGFQQYLQTGGVDKDSAKKIVQSFEALPAINVCGIFIRRLSGHELAPISPIIGAITLFEDYFDLALAFMRRGVMGAESLWPLLKVFHNQFGMSDQRIRELLRIHFDIACDVNFDVQTLKPYIENCQKEIAANVQTIEPVHVLLSSYSEENIIEAADHWVRKH